MYAMDVEDVKVRNTEQKIAFTDEYSLISVALSNDFAMNALLAFSASHLAWQTKNNDTEHLVYQHKDIALKGLSDALGSFSEHNSEAVLAASMLLAWQARDWSALPLRYLISGSLIGVGPAGCSCSRECRE